MTRVLVFGVFDGLHPGHRSFLRQARSEGDRLIAAVARDSVVERLKGRRPEAGEGERMRALLESGLVDGACLGDEEPGTYAIVDRIEPGVICLGHDQDALKADLERWLCRRGRNLRLITLSAYRPDLYKSSKLKGRSVDGDSRGGYSPSGMP